MVNLDIFCLFAIDYSKVYLMNPFLFHEFFISENTVMFTVKYVCHLGSIGGIAYVTANYDCYFEILSYKYVQLNMTKYVRHDFCDTVASSYLVSYVMAEIRGTRREHLISNTFNLKYKGVKK